MDDKKYWIKARALVGSLPPASEASTPSLRSKYDHLEQILSQFDRLEQKFVTSSMACNQSLEFVSAQLHEIELEQSKLQIKRQTLLTSMLEELEIAVHLFKEELNPTKELDEKTAAVPAASFDFIPAPEIGRLDEGEDQELDPDALKRCFPISLPCPIQAKTLDGKTMMELYLWGSNPENQDYFVQLRSLGELSTDLVFFSSISEAYKILSIVASKGTKFIDMNILNAKSKKRTQFKFLPHTYFHQQGLNFDSVLSAFKQLQDLDENESLLLFENNDVHTGGKVRFTRETLKDLSRFEYPDSWIPIVGSRRKKHD